MADKNRPLNRRPAEKVLQKSVISPLPQVLNPDEELKVIEAAIRIKDPPKNDPRSYLLVTLLLSTGLRRASALR
jgi:integrase/recombinase XerD